MSVWWKMKTKEMFEKIVSLSHWRKRICSLGKSCSDDLDIVIISINSISVNRFYLVGIVDTSLSCWPISSLAVLSPVLSSAHSNTISRASITGKYSATSPAGCTSPTWPDQHLLANPTICALMRWYDNEMMKKWWWEEDLLRHLWEFITQKDQLAIKREIYMTSVFFVNIFYLFSHLLLPLMWQFLPHFVIATLQAHNEVIHFDFLEQLQVIPSWS